MKTLRATPRVAGAVTAALVVLSPLVARSQPVRVAFTSETLPVPGNQAGDTALLRDPWGQWRDLVFGGDAVNNGFYGFLVDGGVAVTTAFGAMGGVDARPPLLALPSSTAGGLVAMSATTAGQVLFHTTHPDGGFPGIGGVAVVTPGPVALSDFGDAGAFLFLNSGGTALLRFRLREDGGAVGAVAEPSITLPFPARAVASSSSLRRVYVSVGIGGVVEVAPLESPPTIVNVIDAGAPAQIAGGLAVYPQRDGGALLITSVPGLELFRVYQARPGQALHLADFTITAVDGGRKVVGAELIDVSPAAFGVTDAGASYDAGVLVVCDRLATAGANYKLVPWASLARATTPPLPIDLPDLVEVPVTPPPPAPLPFSLARPQLGAAAVDLSFWPGRDSLLAVFDGVTRLSNVELRTLDSLPADAGAARAVDVLGPVSWATGGLAAVAHVRADGGALTLWTSGADGGLVLVGTISVPATGPLALADFADAGVRLFAAEDASVRQFVLGAQDGGVLVRTLPDVLAPAAVASLGATAQRLVAATSGGVFELDVSGSTAPRQLVDGGARGLAFYPQRDGGALLLTVNTAGDRLHVFELHGPSPLVERFSFEVGPGDGGRVTDAVAVDVTPTRAGLLPDGGAVWPTGVLAIATQGADAGSVLLVPWNTIASAATPPLPIELVAGGAGGAGGGRAGGSAGGTIIPIGGRNGGGGAGGGGEPPPPGCCNGAPTAALIPSLAFLIWLAGFRRRRP
ncbi:MAG: hypothetical protein JNJ54_23980 [Myxococcaceae bacterium]|nr:hypothetical protein [Myxococcaceae bacterium]